jgi:hypothetical protein
MSPDSANSPKSQTVFSFGCLHFAWKTGRTFERTTDQDREEGDDQTLHFLKSSCPLSVCDISSETIISSHLFSGPPRWLTKSCWIGDFDRVKDFVREGNWTVNIHV